MTIRVGAGKATLRTAAAGTAVALALVAGAAVAQDKVGFSSPFLTDPSRRSWPTRRSSR